LKFVVRPKDVTIAGRKCVPSGAEKVPIEHPLIAEAAVVSVPDM
jgi:acyl-CoA synthetase (AMP-forming)/AMP-acid ligase II